MALRSLQTEFHLPPGLPRASTACELFQRVFSEYRWFQPRRFGRFAMDEQIEPGHFDPKVLAAYYDEHKLITIGAATDRDYLLLFPSKEARYPFIGKFFWSTSVVEAKKPGWREAHLRQVVEVMHLLGSPLARSGVGDDFERKDWRTVPNEDGFGSTQVFNLRDYSEGLTGLFWRNVFGAPFVKHFGSRLDAIPAPQRQSLDGGLVLVQPYELPTQAMTPEGDAAEARLITTLGPESFFDLPTLTRPTRVLDPASLPPPVS